MWRSIDPEVQGALIGVGALGATWAGHIVWDYARYKLTGNGKNGKCNGSQNGHCKDHASVMDMLIELKKLPPPGNIV